VKNYRGGFNWATAQFMEEECQAEIEEARQSIPTATPRMAPTATPMVSECTTEFDVTKPIRVLLAKEVSDVRLEGKGKAEISSTGRTLSLKLPLKIKMSGKGISLNGKSLKSSECEIRTSDSSLSFKDVSYRGYFKIIVRKGKLCLLNHVTCEEYLRGVLPKEVPASWSSDALKAQAISARTYVLFQAEKNRDKYYDVYATVISQVYGGIPAEKATTDKAVAETRGLVLCHKAKLIISYFHSNSGGYTEASKNVWVADLPYLASVPDSYSQGTPNYEWEATIPVSHIEARLKAKGIKIGSLKKLSVVEESASGRAIRLKLKGSKGEHTLKSNDFRLIVSAMKIKSTKFNVSKKGRNMVFSGNGFGHGVGLPQWSAKKMAEAGHSYEDILKTYFLNVEITRLY